MCFNLFVTCHCKSWCNRTKRRVVSSKTHTWVAQKKELTESIEQTQPLISHSLVKIYGLEELVWGHHTQVPKIVSI